MWFSKINLRPQCGKKENYVSCILCNCIVIGSLENQVARKTSPIAMQMFVLHHDNVPAHFCHCSPETDRVKIPTCSSLLYFPELAPFVWRITAFRLPQWKTGLQNLRHENPSEKLTSWLKFNFSTVNISTIPDLILENRQIWLKRLAETDDVSCQHVFDIVQHD